MIKLLLGEIRIREGLSIRELAKLSGVSKAHIEKIEKNKTKPSLEVMDKLARTLGVKITDLYEYQESK